MAKQIITTITDDLDGSAADETVSFAIDGIGYEIDLNGRNAMKLREFLGAYVEAGTRLGRVDSGRHAQISRYTAKASSVPAAANREQNTKIRAWAAENGWQLSDRGRIPQQVVDAYESKTPNPQWLAQQAAAQKVADEVADGKAPAKATRPRRGATTTPAFAG